MLLGGAPQVRVTATPRDLELRKMVLSADDRSWGAAEDQGSSPGLSVGRRKGCF